MPVRSPARRAVFPLALTLVAFSLAAPASATHAPMNQSTQGANAMSITSTSAEVSGSAGSYDSSACSWYFEYGTTTSYGQATPVVAGCAGAQQHVETLTGLSPKTTYHVRLVVIDHSGSTLYGGDKAFTTLDPKACPTSGPSPDSDGDLRPDCQDNCPTLDNYKQEDHNNDGVGDACDGERNPAPPNSKTTSRTLQPGGSMSTGSDVSRANPIVVKLTAHGGGTWHIDEMADPNRPGVSENDEGSERDPKDWFGPGIRITPPDLTEQKDQLVRVEFTVDGATNLSARGLETPLGSDGCGFPQQQIPAGFGKNDITYMPNGDVRLTWVLDCTGAKHLEAHFYNPKWGIDRRENTTAPGDESLNEVLKSGLFRMHIACKLRCEREAVATIKPSSAKQLGLKSNVIARGSSGMRFDPDERHCPSKYLDEFMKSGPQDRCVALVLTKQAKKKLKGVKKITVTFKWKATGARAGQKAAGRPSQAYKRTQGEQDDLGPAAAAAASPDVSTYQPENITETSADFTGQVHPYSGATYHFEYGTTKDYGSSTPEASAGAPPPAQPAPIRQTVTGLTPGTVYHVRLVGTGSSGEKGYGEDAAFKTLGAPPLPAGATRKSGTADPGEKVSTGLEPSRSNPVVVVSAEFNKGGTFYIDSLPDPRRPGADPDEEENPEDESSKTKLWYGPALRITPPSSASRFTYVFRIDGDTDRQSGVSWRDAKNPVATYGPSPYGKGCRVIADRNKADVRYLKNGDTELTQTYGCFGVDQVFTFDFYNQPWGWSSREGVDADYGTLDTILDNGYIGARIACHQKCARSGKATIAKKTAKALRLKSTTIATGGSALDATMRDTDQFKGLAFKLKLTAKARKALKRASRITISFKLKAVGSKGQVLTKTFKRTYERSPESRGDDINRKT